MNYSYNFQPEFEVENYLKHQVERFSKRFDPNSYLYITKAMDYFDLASRGGGSLEIVFKDIKSQFLIIAFLLGIEREPEIHTGPCILHTALLVVGIHDGLDDTEAEATAAIGAGMRLVHLEELLPDLLQVLLWNRLAGV